MSKPKSADRRARERRLVELLREIRSLDVVEYAKLKHELLVASGMVVRS